ncbi:hypothetical protein SCHPADRAFT_850420 [Schizopora paradoxa]|uniref:CCHC-type domain-containing protein n=1 Tax=Schizopora paradoxa TaxID=27342 RepID=A0A0H2RZM9_9AGAM|nr:hypothetical protein SCHPADRAFT_850420 [Schizopora paradoxa]
MTPFDESLFYSDANGMGSGECHAREYFEWREHLVSSNFNGQILGISESLESEVDFVERTEQRCFNCGVEGHAVRSCPEPRNPQLIALSRAMYQFYRDLEGRESASDPERLHVVEEWSTQRLHWLDHFSPGEIKGELLREALGLSEGDKGENVEWLSNMLIWGYPKGWLGPSDPRRAIRQRILGPSVNHDDSLEFNFIVFGEDGDDEHLVVKPRQGDLEGDNYSDDTSSVSSTDTLRSHPDGLKLRRWAVYQTTLFSSELLPAYSGLPLPSMEEEDLPLIITDQLTDDFTFTEDRATLWMRLSEQNHAPPPPPSSTPPPPPPPPPPDDLVPVPDDVSGWSSFQASSGIRDWCCLPFSSDNVSKTLDRKVEEDVEEEDMDLSD